MLLDIDDYETNGVAWPFDLSDQFSAKQLEPEYFKFQTLAKKTFGKKVSLKPNLLSTFFDALAFDSEVIKQVSRVIGPDIYIWSSAFFFKAPKDGRIVSFHQDNPYWQLTSDNVVTAWIALIYLALTFLCALAYWLAGMNGFDAWAHAMTTIATGGFSTHDGSIGYFASPAIDAIATTFMLAGALPFVLYLRFIRGQRRAIFVDSQVKLFTLLVLIAVGATSLFLIINLDMGPVFAIRYAAFNVISMMTGTE